MKSGDVCKSVDPRVKSEVETLTKQLQFMAAKLKETQKLIKEEPLVIEYDNGGGQSGIRENPSFIAYEKLLSTYNKTLTSLISIIGEQQAASEVMPLSELRGKFKVAR